MATKLPRVIETERLRIELYTAEQIETVVPELVRANLEYLAEWMPWAAPDVFETTDYAEIAVDWLAQAQAGTSFNYGIWVKEGDEKPVGTIGIHHRNDQPPESLEIGYWLVEDAQGNGYVTEVTAALTAAAFGNGHIEKVEIACEPGNEKSEAIPKRLDFSKADMRLNHDNLNVRIWEMERQTYSR